MIFLKANSWTQDEVNVYITLDKIPKAQVTWSPLFVSITNSDFIFNLHSLHETKSGTVSHTSSGSILTLSKCVKCEWKDLSYNDTKAALNDRKLKSLESVSKVLGDKQLEFNAAASKNDRSLISHQMKLEQSKRQVIQEKKNIEKALEEEELKRWTEEIESVQEPIENDNQESKAPLVDETLYTRITFEDVVLDDSEIDMDLVMKNVAKQLPPERVLPPPRQSSSINFEFSSRGLLPTKVARQSEDSKWIARIEQAQQQHVQSLNLKQNNELKVDDITENAHQLFEKAKTFTENKDYSAAINAYSALLLINKTHIPSLLNRASLSLLLHNYSDSIADCTLGISLLDIEEQIENQGMMNGDAINVPRVQKRDRRRSLFLVKRSAAFYQGGKYKECECDLKIASMLMPNDQGLQNDLAQVQKLLKI